MAVLERHAAGSGGSRADIKSPDEGVLFPGIIRWEVKAKRWDEGKRGFSTGPLGHPIIVCNTAHVSSKLIDDLARKLASDKNFVIDD